MPANHNLYREQVSYLARQIPANVAITGGTALLISFIIWDEAHALRLLLWILAHLAITSIVFLRYLRRRNRSRRVSESAPAPQDARHRPAMPLAVIWGTLSGAVWGSTAFLLPELNPTLELAVIIVMVSMASGASSTLAAVPLAATGFILADMTPLIIYLFLQQTMAYTVLGLLGGMFSLVMVASTRVVYSHFLEASENRRDNALLLNQIREERQAAQESLLLSEERYSDVVETIGDMIVNTDARGKFLFANRSWRTTLGYDDDDLASLTFLDVIDDEYRTFVERLTGKIAKKRTPETAEFVFKAKDGRRVWVEANANPMFKNGKFSRINGIFRDISQRKQAERTLQEEQAQLQLRVAEATRGLAEINASLQQEVSERRQAERAWRNSEAQLRLILDSTVEAIYGVDLDGRCTFVNLAGAHLLGYEEPVEMLGADMHALAHVQSVASSAEDCPICLVHRCNSRGHSDNQYFTRRNGEQFPVEYSAGSILRDGLIVGGVVAFLDITRRRAVEEQLRQSQKMEAIGQLTGGIAHDFNNLLAIIVGNLDLMASGLGTDEISPDIATKRRAEAALRAAERASDLTQRLLSFSRQTILSPQIINPGAMVEDMSEILRRVLGDDIVFVLHMAAPLWETNIDQSQFENTLLNLSINARDAMANGGKLTIDITNVSLAQPLHLPRSTIPEGDYIKLTVGDTGVGIPDTIIGRVFEPFFTTKSVGQGTGLGLSMVYGFVEQSSGFIDIESETGNGTLVSIYLPRATPVEMPTDEKEPAGNNEDQKSVNIMPGDACILVVEDDPGVRNATVAQISSLGYKVLTAGHGAAALEIYKANPGINLVYTDIMMPYGMNGPALAARLKEINPNIKVLFCTGFGGDTLHDLDVSLAALVLQKPVRIAVLQEKLREILKA